MKQLRKTIRRILIENAQEMNELVDGILGDDPEYITTFLELAETLGYINDYGTQYSPPKPRQNFHAPVWHWYFDCDTEFGDLLLSKYEPSEYGIYIESTPVSNGTMYHIHVAIAGPES